MAAIIKELVDRGGNGCLLSKFSLRTIELIDAGQTGDIKCAGTETILGTAVGRGATSAIQIQFKRAPGFEFDQVRIEFRSEYTAAGSQHFVKNQFAITYLTRAEKPASITLRVVAEPENNHPAIHQYLDDITLAIM